jgi:hypothetical protein
MVKGKFTCPKCGKGSTREDGCHLHTSARKGWTTNANKKYIAKKAGKLYPERVVKEISESESSSEEENPINIKLRDYAKECEANIFLKQMALKKLTVIESESEESESSEESSNDDNSEDSD